MGGAGGYYGGGAITIISDTLTNNGAIRSNGHNGAYLGFQNAPAGGAGGGILIRTRVLSIIGKLEANGGNGADYTGAGGGGAGSAGGAGVGAGGVGAFVDGRVKGSAGADSGQLDRVIVHRGQVGSPHRTLPQVLCRPPNL